MELIVYPENASLKLEFDLIKSTLLKNCISNLGSKEILNASFLTDQKSLVRKLAEVREFQDILNRDLNFPVEYYFDLTEVLSMCMLPEFSMLAGDLHQLNQFLHTIEQIFYFLKKNRDEFPHLFFFIRDLDFKKSILEKISTVCDADGQIKSTASDKLFTIRLGIATTESETDKNFDKILRFCKSKGWLTDELETVRNGERVLAFHSRYKRKIKGIVYDESLTGKTIFIQPESVLDLRNKLFDLKQKERREIYMILRDITKFLRPHLPVIQQYQQLISQIDFCRAKAIYANYIGAKVPLISAEPGMKILQGYHPVLLLKNRISGRETVPFDIELNKNKRIMVISGPNAGGKSVCLKTAGLLQLMVQFALPVPADENSVFGIFNKILVDIGDDQSIENDLSTYSSRLINQNYFLEHADQQTLFLIDEFGSGTDPAAGGVIAEVVLEKLNHLKSFGIATTHYTNLKVLAGNTPELINAAMLFDQKSLKPLFKLKPGEPGNSFALEILENIGFNKHLIEKAHLKMAKDEMELHKLLLDLQEKVNKTDALSIELQNKEYQLNNAKIKYDEIATEIKQKKNQIIVKAREDAEAYLQKLISEFEDLIRKWKQLTSEKKADMAKDIRKRIIIHREKNINDLNRLRLTKSSNIKTVFSVDDDVIFKDTGQKGKIIKIQKNKATVVFGSFKTETSLDNLSRTEKVTQPKQKTIQKTVNPSIFKIKSAAFRPELDIRGVRRDEALRELENFIDKAILSDFTELRIIHGHGNGILKMAVREMLKKFEIVKNIRSEHPDFGGDGVTIAEL